MAATGRQREIGGGGSKAAPRHGGGVAAAWRHHQWRQRRRWGRMTKAAAVMVCGGEKKLFLRFLNFDVWQGGRLSGRPFCSRHIPRVRFLSEQSHLLFIIYDGEKPRRLKNPINPSKVPKISNKLEPLLECSPSLSSKCIRYMMIRLPDVFCVLQQFLIFWVEIIQKNWTFVVSSSHLWKCPFAVFWQGF